MEFVESQNSLACPPGLCLNMIDCKFTKTRCAGKAEVLSSGVCTCCGHCSPHTTPPPSPPIPPPIPSPIPSPPIPSPPDQIPVPIPPNPDQQQDCCCCNKIPDDFTLPCMEQKKRQLAQKAKLVPDCSQQDEKIYRQIQCDINTCYCVSQTGQILYKLARINANGVHCACAQAFNSHAERKLRCDDYGNYKEVFCEHPSSCTCYDRFTGSIVHCTKQILQILTNNYLTQLCKLPIELLPLKPPGMEYDIGPDGKIFLRPPDKSTGPGPMFPNIKDILDPSEIVPPGDPFIADINGTKQVVVIPPTGTDIFKNEMVYIPPFFNNTIPLSPSLQFCPMPGNVRPPLFLVEIHKNRTGPSFFGEPCKQTFEMALTRYPSFVPNCDKKHHVFYEPLQCDFYGCYCYDNIGNLLWILDPAVTPMFGNAACNCPLAFKNGHERFKRCAVDGKFKPEVCMKDSCHYFDVLTGRLLEKKPPVMQEWINPDIELLNYRLLYGSPLNFPESCTSVLMKLQQQQAPSHALPKCDNNGGYQLLQCFGDRCFCYTSSGIVLWVFQNRGQAHMNICSCALKFTKLQERLRVCSNIKSTTIPNFSVPCSVARNEAIKFHFPLIPVCAANGAYRLMQCDKLYCYCVSENGKYTGFKAPVGQPLYCECPAIMKSKLYIQHNKYVPTCDKNGAYIALQKLLDGRYFCINANFQGTLFLNIPSGAQIQPGRTYCVCATKLTGPLDPESVLCDEETGNYRRAVCRGSDCFCLNVHTGQRDQCHPEEMVLFGACYRAIKDKKERELRCNKDDGYFLPWICSGNVCYCVNEKTGASESCIYQTPRIGVGLYLDHVSNYTHSSGPCFAQRAHAIKVKAPLIPRCQKSNSMYFAQHQCTDKECMCVGSHGVVTDLGLPLTKINDHLCSACLMRHRQAKKLSVTANYLVPQCNSVGEYSFVEFTKDGKMAFCYDRFANQVWKINLKHFDPTLSYCQCIHKTPFSTERLMKCDPERGNFKTRLCVNDECFCFNEFTGIKTPCKPSANVKVSISTSESLGYFTGACFVRRRAAIEADYSIIPRCMSENPVYFAPHQCGPIDCMCVERSGKPSRLHLQKTAFNDQLCTAVLGPCVKDRTVENKLAESYVASCTEAGFFRYKQCTTSKCFCVLSDGTHKGPVVPVTTSLSCICPMVKLENTHNNALWIPLCNADGSFQAMQCTSSGWCCCMNWKGEQTWVIGNHSPPKTTCTCASSIENLQERLRRCDAFGNFLKEICENENCSCFNEFTGAPVKCESRTNVKHIELLAPKITLGKPCNVSLAELKHQGAMVILPRCTRDPMLYQPLQCGLKRCNCHGPDGKLIRENLPIKTSSDMTCFAGINRQCIQNRLYFVDGIGWVHSVCEQSYLYDKKQCGNSICMCVSREGKSLMYMAPVNKTLYCGCPRQQAMDRTSSCSNDGHFLPVQCNTEICKCVDKFGFPLPYKADEDESNVDYYYRWKRSSNVTSECACAIKESDAENSVIKDFSRKLVKEVKYGINCDNVGNYIPMQCENKNKCYCVDPLTGKQTSSKVVPSKMKHTLPCAEN